MSALAPRARFCASCGGATTPGARFCHQCGRPLGSGARFSLPLLVGAGLALAGLMLVLTIARRSSTGAPQPAASPALSGRAPDISALSPRERFDRLFERAEDYAARGDTARMIQFADHALAAYGQLPEVDAEARYRAGLLQVRLNRNDAALALADSILARDPQHRLGLDLRATVSRRRASP